jgi:hypothetical protein
MSRVFNSPVRSPELIGRQVEVASLHTLIDQVTKGQGQVVLFGGEAGIGKYRTSVPLGRRPATTRTRTSFASPWPRAPESRAGIPAIWRNAAANANATARSGAG